MKGEIQLVMVHPADHRLGYNAESALCNKCQRNLNLKDGEVLGMIDLPERGVRTPLCRLGCLHTFLDSLSRITLEEYKLATQKI